MGGNGLPIARLFGIEIRVSFTWAILVAIVTLLGAQQVALTAPGLAAPVQCLIGVAIAVVATCNGGSAAKVAATTRARAAITPAASAERPYFMAILMV
jgi:hypothetical protein